MATLTTEVDIGPNLTSLLEQLASQIGVTIDKIYPWYVHQAYLEGITNIIALIIALTVFSTLTIVFYKKANWKHGNPHIGFCIVSTIALGFSVLCAFGTVPNSVTKVLNPNYAALGMLTDDLKKLKSK